MATIPLPSHTLVLNASKLTLNKHQIEEGSWKTIASIANKPEPAMRMRTEGMNLVARKDNQKYR